MNSKFIKLPFLLFLDSTQANECSTILSRNGTPWGCCLDVVDSDKQYCDKHRSNGGCVALGNRCMGLYSDEMSIQTQTSAYCSDADYATKLIASHTKSALMDHWTRKKCHGECNKNSQCQEFAQHQFGDLINPLLTISNCDLFSQSCSGYGGSQFNIFKTSQTFARPLVDCLTHQLTPLPVAILSATMPVQYDSGIQEIISTYKGLYNPIQTIHCAIRPSCIITKIYEAYEECMTAEDCGISIDSSYYWRSDDSMDFKIVIDTSVVTFVDESFYISCKNSGAGIMIQSPVFTVTNICFDNQYTISEGINARGLNGSKQYVQINDRDHNWNTLFLVNTIELSIPQCRLQNTELIEATSGIFLQFDRSYWIVAPFDRSINAEYTFKIKITGIGGKIFITPQKTLVVGCTNSLNFFKNPKFVDVLKIKVGEQGKEIYEIYPPSLSLPYCSIDKVEIIEVKFENIPHESIAYLSKSCENSLLCFQIDLKSTLTEGVISFKIKYIHSSGITYIDPAQIHLECSSLTNHILPTNQVNRMIFKDSKEPFNLFEWTDYSCSFPISCCNSFYYLITNSQQTTDLSSLNDITRNNTLKTNSIKIPTNIIKKHKFYIYAISDFQQFIYSQQIIVSVEFDCMNENFKLNSLPPKTNSEWFRANQGIQQLQAFFVETKVEKFSVNLKDRFVGQDQSQKCVIQKFKIQKVLDKNQFNQPVIPAIYEKIIKLFENGKLQVLEFKKEYNYIVYIQPFNTFKWVDMIDEPPLAIVKNQKLFSPNFSPQFKDDLIAPVFRQKQNIDREEVLEYKLPEVFDPNIDDEIKIEVSNLPTLMSYNQTERKIVCHINKLKKSQIFTIYINLSDGKGGKRSYKLNIETIKYVEFHIAVGNNEEGASEIQNNNKNVSAEIESISPFGEIVVKFNCTMNTNISLDVFNSSISLYAQPEYKRSILPNYNETLISLQWYVKSFKNDTMNFQLVFDFPLEISPLEMRDKLVLNITNSTNFYSPQMKKNIHKDFRILKSDIRKQIPLTNSYRNMVESVVYGTQALQIALVVTFFINFFLSGGMIYMIGLIRAIQIILHLPMFNMILPGNISIVFQTIVPIAMFDILDEKYFSMFLEFDIVNQKIMKSQIKGQLQELGYESYNSLLNLGTLAMFTFIYVFRIVLWVIFILVNKFTANKFKKLKKFTDDLGNQLFFREIIALFIEAYLEFLIAGNFCIKNKVDPFSGEVLSDYIGNFGLIVTYVLMPMSFIYVICQSPEKFKQSLQNHTWGVYFEGVANKNKFQQLFYLVFMFRRMAYITLGMEIKTTIFQILGLLYINMSMLIYTGVNRPLETRLRNQLEIFNEFCICFICIHLIIFTEWVDNQNSQFMMGFSMIFIIILNIIVNFSLVLWFGVHHIKIICIKYKRIIVFYLPYYCSIIIKYCYCSQIRDRIHYEIDDKLQINHMSLIKKESVKAQVVVVKKVQIGSSQIQEESKESQQIQMKKPQINLIRSGIPIQHNKKLDFDQLKIKKLNQIRRKEKQQLSIIQEQIESEYIQSKRDNYKDHFESSFIINPNQNIIKEKQEERKNQNDRILKDNVSNFQNFQYPEVKRFEKRSDINQQVIVGQNQMWDFWPYNTQQK